MTLFCFVLSLPEQRYFLHSYPVLLVGIVYCLGLFRRRREYAWVRRFGPLFARVGL